MVPLFRYLPTAETAFPVGKREAKRIGCDENYACDPHRPFLVSAPDRATAAKIGADYAACMADEDADMGDLMIEQEYGASPNETICYIARAH